MFNSAVHSIHADRALRGEPITKPTDPSELSLVAPATPAEQLEIVNARRDLVDQPGMTKAQFGQVTDTASVHNEARQALIVGDPAPTSPK
jgi:hypothetical protein